MGRTDTLTKLKELTSKLPAFPESLESIRGDKENPRPNGKSTNILDSNSNGYREYQMEQGECFAWFIHRSGNDVAVHRWFNSGESKFPEHTHPEKEFIVIYKGIMDITKNGETKRLMAGDYIYNEPLAIHSAYFPEDCKYITVTIPPAKEFPNGK